VRWSDVVSLDAVRRPPAGVQARIVRREPDRATVVAGEPATVGDLRRRYGRPGAGGFAAFVARQATLALERAERGLLGDHVKVPRLIAEAIEDSPEYRREVAELAARLELPESEVARRAAADLHGLVASMSPIAIDLLTGAARPLHSRAWTCRSTRPGWPGCGSATAPTRWCSCPATAATPIRCCSPTCSPSATSPATTCSAGTT
jgi:glycerol-3-phosphate O-acyltransferase